MDWDSSALIPYRLRTVRVGLQLTLVTVAILVVYRLMPGRGHMEDRQFTVLLIAGVLGAGIVSALPWKWLFKQQFGMLALYTWTCADILLISMGIAATGGAQSPLYLLYALTSVFFSASYPPRAQAALLSVTVGSYLLVAMLGATPISAAELFVRMAQIVLITYITLFLSKELMREMLAHHELSNEERRRSQLLATVASAGARQSLDAPLALSAMGDAIDCLGFDLACVSLPGVDGQFRVAYGNEKWQNDKERWMPGVERLAYLVDERRELVTLSEHLGAGKATEIGNAFTLVGVPILSGEELSGLLIAGAPGDRAISPAELEALELLAVQAGFALENADLAEGLRQREARFRALVQKALDVVCVLNADGRLSYVSPGIEAMLGYSPRYAVGANAFEDVHADDVAALRERFEWLLSSPGQAIHLEFRMRHRDGSWRWVEAVFTNLVEDPAVSGVVVNFRDITERKAFEKQLQYQAFHDTLTGLPNRAHLIQRLTQSTQQGHDSTLAVLLLDLDEFKKVNDSLGHDMGDQLLVAIADQLKNLLRTSELLARLGGDEFTILVEGADAERRALELAEAIAATMAAGVLLGSRLYNPTMSIGIALASEDGRVGTDLLRRADLAMYAAKDRGKAQYAFFDSSMSQRARERLQLESELRQAIANREFYLDYQPLVALGASMELIGVEALVRWKHPTRGMVTPAEFIPLAEESGLILLLGRWVLEEACRQIKEWRATAAGMSLYVSVNVSPRQFEQPGFAQQVRQVLESLELDARALQVEITESILMEDARRSRATLEELREIGVRIAIDDFGTGYSSLSYLRTYPVDVLKVDRSFVESIETEDDARTLVNAIIGLARSLDLLTVAEGIETEQQVDLLRELHCDIGQGFHLGRPVSAADISRLVGISLGRAAA